MYFDCFILQLMVLGHGLLHFFLVIASQIMNIVKICFQALKNFPETFESITYEDFMHAYALGKLLRFKPFTCSNWSELFASIVLNYNF